MKKLLFILLLVPFFAEAQLFPVPITHENDNYHFTKTVFVDRKFKVGVGSTINQDVELTADTLRLTGLDGTGFLLSIDVNGDVTRSTGIGAGGISGLNPTPFLYGSAAGNIAQDLQGVWIEGTNSLIIGDASDVTGFTQGSVVITNGIDNSSLTADQLYIGNFALGTMWIDGLYLRYMDLGGDLFSIGRVPWSADMNLLFPAAKGSLDQALKVGSVVGDDVNLVWYTPLTLSALSATSPIGYNSGTGVFNLLGSAADKMLYTTGINTWAETASTAYGRSVMALADVSANLSLLSMPIDDNLITFGNGTLLINKAGFSYDDATDLFKVQKIEMNGATGRINLYENSVATDGSLFIGNTTDGEWVTGSLLSSDLDVTYSNPNINFSYAVNSILNADINSGAAIAYSKLNLTGGILNADLAGSINATKINTGVVDNTEFNYLDNVTSAIQTQLNLKAPLASPTFTGTVTIPTPFTLGATSVTTTGTQLNYLNAATGTTGSTNLVYSASPALTGIVSMVNATLSGKIGSYNGIATVANGIPSAVALVNLTAQTAAIAATNIYTATADGFYQVCWSAEITTAATTSATLGHFQARYTSAADNVVKTTSTQNNVTASAANATTGTASSINGVFTIYAKASTNIQYIMGYASSGATAMQYSLNIIVVKL